MANYPIVVIGAGPAGLTAAYELTKHGENPCVLEATDKVGGISRTEVYKGYRFDIGGHRFYTKVEIVNKLWQEVLAKDFIKVPRLSRIYYKNKFYDYPLSLLNTLFNLGLIESFLILLSYLKAKVRAKMRPNWEAETFEEWVIDCFGSRLYLTFFKHYTEKVWGIPCSKIQAEWAAQRIKGLSLKRAVINAVFGSNDTKTLIKEFDYPILGPGMMWERFQELLNLQGSPVIMNTRVTKIERDGNRIKKIIANQNGETITIFGDQFISSMPVSLLLKCLDPLPPENVLAAANGLNYRDFLIVTLIVDEEHLFPDNWIYIHNPEFKVGRIQNFKNWSAAMVPDQSKTCLGMEYFTSEGDMIWEMSDSKLFELASQEIKGLGLVEPTVKIEDGIVIRQKKAYPVYDGEYRQHLQVIQEYLQTFENLQTVGRNGMHRYNNQDHSMLTGVLAARNLLGEEHDLWDVNTERSYHEEFTKEKFNQKDISPNNQTEKVVASTHK
ncbi:MAG: NAD(P)/FAD-dependent oxidoreductase [Microcoleaceae cyanobacterium]